MTIALNVVPNLDALVGLVDCRPHADHPGWFQWEPVRKGLFTEVLGPLMVRSEGPKRARVRLLSPQVSHLNMANVLHGGMLLTFADIALFCGSFFGGLGERALGGQTVQLDVHFLSAARVETTLDALVELVHETGSMAFLRAQLDQAGERRATISALMRKAPSSRRAAHSALPLPVDSDAGRPSCHTKD